MPTRFDPATGGLIFTPQEKDNEVIIKKAADFPTVIDSAVVYFIDGIIDMGATEITVPNGGMYVNGHGYGISGLFSTENSHTMFKTGLATYAGDVIITGCTIYTTGTSSMIFDLDNDGNNSAFELNSVNLGDFSVTTTSLGAIANYRQVRTGDFAAIKYTDGLTFDGEFSGIAFNDSILLANVASSTFLQAGVALDITGGMSSDMNALGLGVGSEWCDFAEANFSSSALMALTGFRTNLSTALPNLDSSSARALFKGCTGVGNTYVGASWRISTEAVTVVASNTNTKVSGTTTEELEAWFEAVGNNRLKYIGMRDISVSVMVSLVAQTTGTESLVFTLRKYDDSAAAFSVTFIDEKPADTQLRISGDRHADVFMLGVANVSTNDYIELWVRNPANGSDPTVLEGAKLVISERV